MTTQPSILIVEDDEAIATGLQLNLRLAGYAPSVVHDGSEALTVIAETHPDLVLLDINLPKVNGLEVLGELRKSGTRIPIVVLSAREGEYDKVAALRLGADDYVTKPFALAELLARIDAVLRRTSATASAGRASHGFGDVEVDIETRTVTRGDAEIRLTHLEFELLRYFVVNPRKVFTRNELLREVWGQSSGSRRTVDNFVGQLRSKLEVDPEKPEHFITVRGSGYRFDP